MIDDRPSASLDFTRDGACHLADAAQLILNPLRMLLDGVPQESAGVRIQGLPLLTTFLVESGPIGRVTAEFLKTPRHPVRAVLFDKTATTNWALGWHQDRTIAVRTRRDVPGFGPWTVKQGLPHVEPPFSITAGMATLRVHLDDVPVDNAPLLIAPGSHRLGRIAIPDIADVVRQCGISTCTARAGDIWVYATPILHASKAAVTPQRRRVLQVDYASEALPHGLEWLGL